MDCSPAMESATHIVLRTKEPRSRCCSSSFISNSAARSPTASFTINPRWPRGPIASSKPPSIKLIIPSKTSSNCSKPRDFVEVFLFTNAAVRIYSVHEPEVQCIAKGKAGKQYEFGNKVSVAVSSRGGWFVGAKSFTGNPYD